MNLPLDNLAVDELVNRAQAGSLNAFSELVRRFEGRLFNFLRGRAANPDDVQDLTQETFLRAWRQLDRYDSKWMFSTWLFTIGFRLAVNHHRSQKRLIEMTHSGGNQPNGSSDPAAIVSNAEQRRNLWALAETKLSEPERAALWLKYAEDHSAADIARVLGRTSVGVRVLLHRARRKLAAELADRRETDAETPFATSASPAVSYVIETGGG